MSLGAKIAWDDTILPFQLDKSDVRGRVLRLDGVLDQVLAQHDYPPAIENLVAEAAMLTVMIGQTIKLRWKLSLQVRGKGAARLIATDYYAPEKDGEPGRIRAYASYDEERLDPNAPGFDQIGDGYLAILIHQGGGRKALYRHDPDRGGQPGRLRQGLFRTVRTAANPVPADLWPVHAGRRVGKLARGWRDVAADAEGLAAAGTGRGKRTR